MRSRLCSADTQRALAVLATIVAISCRAPERPIIGLGYSGQHPIEHMAPLAFDPLSEFDSLSEFVTAMAIGITTEGEGPPTSVASNSAAEVDRAARLTRTPGLVGVVGHGGSREALMTAPIYNEAHIPQIVPTATSRRLRTAGPWTFMLAPDDSTEGAFLGRFITEELGATSATVFYVLDEYGAGLRDGVIADLGRRGVRVLDAVPVSPGGACPPDKPANDYAAVVDAAQLHGRPDVVVLAARQRESGCIVARVAQRQPASVFVAGDGLTPDASFRSRAGAAAEGLYLAAFWHPSRADALSRVFVARYTRLFGVAPTAQEAMIFDALRALGAAVRAVGPDPGRMRLYLLSLGRTRAALRGVTGRIAFPGGPDKLLMTRLRGDGSDLLAFQ
jgi:ABC-type branched-subunit amino acid transport system substrate-binding protein